MRVTDLQFDTCSEPGQYTFNPTTGEYRFHTYDRGWVAKVNPGVPSVKPVNASRLY